MRMCVYIYVYYLQMYRDKKRGNEILQRILYENIKIKLNAREL